MIFFFYYGGRKERLENLSKFPNEFFYGYQFISKKKKIIEEDFKNKDRYRYKILSYVLRKIFFFDIHYFGLLKNYKTIKDKDVCIGSTDSISIGLALYKFIFKKKFKIIYLGMGYMDILMKLKKKSYVRYYMTKLFLRLIFNKVNNFIFLGEGELDLFNSEFLSLCSRSKFIPFGVDEKFWTLPNNASNNDNYILFIGNDKNRDYLLLKEIIKSNVNLLFKVITNKKNFFDHHLYKNLSFTDSDWKKAKISDNEILNIYSKAKLVIIPLKNVSQPSGQSVCLQAMSCSKCVLISDTKGFWDKRIIHQNHLIKISDNKISNWNKEIRKYFHLDNTELENNAKKIISQLYTSRIFGKEIANIIDLNQ